MSMKLKVISGSELASENTPIVHGMPLKNEVLRLRRIKNAKISIELSNTVSKILNLYECYCRL